MGMSILQPLSDTERMPWPKGFVSNGAICIYISKNLASPLIYAGITSCVDIYGLRDINLLQNGMWMQSLTPRRQALHQRHQLQKRKL